MSLVKSDIQELARLEKEIKYTNNHLKKLREKKAEVESRIERFLESKGQTAIKYQGMVITKKETTRRTRTKKEEKVNRLSYVLQKNGISHSHDVAKQLLESLKGEATSISKITIKKK